MSRKLIFLDVDGTLVDFTMHMPESAREALSIARKRGHLISLCTGRTVTNVYPWLLEFGFDVIVASAGAYVSANDKVIYHSVLANDKVQDMVEVLKEHGACFMLQGINGRYVDEENAKKMRERCMRLGLDIDGALNGLTLVEHPEQMPALESGMYFDADIPVDVMQKEVGNYIKITGASFGKDRQMSGEMTKMGVNKATGMQRLMDELKIGREDTIAFGDGPNDVEMLQFAGTGVAMGNAIPAVKQYADMVTDKIDEDGLYHAFERLHLLG